MRKRSPSRAPPDSGLSGSQASTATVCPRPRRCSISLPVRVLLPTPPLPVTATTRAGLAGGPTPARISSTCRPADSRLSSRARARRSRRRKRSKRGSSMAGGAPLAEEVHDLGDGGARPEDAGHAHLPEFRDVALWHDAADQDADV